MPKRQRFTLTRHLRSGKNVTNAGLKANDVRSLVAYALLDNGAASRQEAAAFADRILCDDWHGAQTIGHPSGYRFTVVRAA
jgi:hypothetical protein